MKISDPMKSRPKEKQVMAQVRMPRALYLEAAAAAKSAEMTLSGLVRGLLTNFVAKADK